MTDTNIVPRGSATGNKRVSFVIILTICMWMLEFISCSVPRNRGSVSIAEIPAQIDPSAMKNEVGIAAWNLIGPFGNEENDVKKDQSRSQVQLLNHDFLADLGHSESTLSADAIKALCAEHQICSVHSPQGAVLNIEKLFPGMAYATVYATTELDSSSDGYVGLEYDSSGASKVWINGQILQEINNQDRHTIFKYSRFLLLHLNKGKNVLVMRVDQRDRATAEAPWATLASLMPVGQMTDRWLESKNGWLLDKVLIKPSESLYMPLLNDKTILDRHSPMFVSIAKQNGDAVFAKTLLAPNSGRLRLPRLGKGLYTVSLKVRTYVIHDVFYIGNPDEVYHALCRIQSKTPTATQEYIQRDPIIQRYRILTSAEHVRPLDLNWQKKLLMVLREGTDATHYPRGAQWSRMPGLHLREFVSRIDRTPQNYLLYVPQVRGPVPLVMIMPAGLEHQRPFLESALLTWAGAIQEIESAGDINGTAVALINGRGSVGDSPIGEADAFEVLNDIISTYQIDTHRLNLYGVCEGGRRALLLAEHYPGVFASIGVYGPILRGYDVVPFRDHGDPSSLVDNLSSTPVMLVSGELDEKSPTATVKAFHKKLVRSGSPSEIEIIPDEGHLSSGMVRKIFPFLVRQQNSHNVQSIDKYAGKAIELAGGNY